MSLIPQEFSSQKQPALTSGLILRLSSLKALLVSGVVLALVLVLSGAAWFYKNSLAEEKQALEQILAEKQGLPDFSEAQNIDDFRANLESIGQILPGHIYASALLQMLKELTLKQVYFSSLNLDIKQRTLNLQGYCASYNQLSKQIVALKNDERLSQVEASSIALQDNGQVGFSLALEFKPAVVLREEGGESDQ